MSFLSIVAVIAGLLMPAFPISEQGAYVSGHAVRADRAFEAAEGAVPPVKTDIASLGPRITAESALVVDAASGAILYEKNASKQWTMASIVKLMTALVFLESGPNMEARLTMEEEDDREGGDDFIRPSQSASTRDVMVASLLGSANNATMTLVRSVAPDVESFVAAMNQKAREMGMMDTVFVDPTGLDAANTSTSRDIALLLKEAGTAEALTSIIGTHRDVIRVYPENIRKPVLTTNHLMGSIVFVEYGKTGHLDESRYNLAVAVTIRSGRTLYIITLGSETNENRVQDSKSLAIWAQNTYQYE